MKNTKMKDNIHCCEGQPKCMNLLHMEEWIQELADEVLAEVGKDFKAGTANGEIGLAFRNALAMSQDHIHENLRTLFQSKGIKIKNIRK